MTERTIEHERAPLLAAVPSYAPDADQKLTRDEFEDNEFGSRTKHYLRVFGVMVCFLTTGITVGGIGALAMDIATFYKINHASVATIFPGGVAGYCITASIMPKVRARYGWRGIARFAPALWVVASLIIVSCPPFKVLMIAYFFFGLGAGFFDAGFCAWASKVPFANIVQGLMHGSFSIGCVVGPIVAAVMTSGKLQWYHFYWLVFGLASFVWILLSIAFHRAAQTAPEERSNDEWKKAPKMVVFVSLFYLVYVSVESTYSQWMITYLQEVRHLPKGRAVLSSSIFFTGMAIGRVSLGPVTEYAGVWSAVPIYIVLSIAAQLAFKLSNGVVISFVALGLNGAFLAPMFPSGIVVIGKSLPLDAAVNVVSTAAALGQVGGALAPLAIGAMADTIGMAHLPDVILTLTAAMLVIWVTFSYGLSKATIEQ